MIRDVERCASSRPRGSPRRSPTTRRTSAWSRACTNWPALWASSRPRTPWRGSKRTSAWRPCCTMFEELLRTAANRAPGPSRGRASRCVRAASVRARGGLAATVSRRRAGRQAARSPRGTAANSPPAGGGNRRSARCWSFTSASVISFDSSTISARLKARLKTCTSSTQTSPGPIRSKRTRSDVSPSSGKSSTWKTYCPHSGRDGHGRLAADPAAARPGRSGSSRGPWSFPSMANRSGGCREASATRSHTDTASRPVAGAANGRLTRHATGPALAILTDCCPPCFCVLSNWMVVWLPCGGGPIGDRAVARRPGARSRGWPPRPAAADCAGPPRGPPAAGSRRPNSVSTDSGQVACGLENISRPAPTAAPPPGRRAPARPPRTRPESPSGRSGAIFRVPVSSSMRHSGPASTWIRAVTGERGVVDRVEIRRPPRAQRNVPAASSTGGDVDAACGVARCGRPRRSRPSESGSPAGRDRRPPGRGRNLPGPSAAPSRRRRSPANRAWPDYGRSAAGSAARRRRLRDQPRGARLEGALLVERLDADLPRRVEEQTAGGRERSESSGRRPPFARFPDRRRGGQVGLRGAMRSGRKQHDRLANRRGSAGRRCPVAAARRPGWSGAGARGAVRRPTPARRSCPPPPGRAGCRAARAASSSAARR